VLVTKINTGAFEVYTVHLGGIDNKRERSQSRTVPKQLYKSMKGGYCGAIEHDIAAEFEDLELRPGFHQLTQILI
jgi:hypothetical protein